MPGRPGQRPLRALQAQAPQACLGARSLPISPADRDLMALVKNFRRALLAALAASALAGWGSTSLPAGEQPPREQTALDITMAAAEDVNPDDQGRAAPILVRVYELKSVDTFNSADYFTLHNSDKKMLGDDMLVRDEFIMRPGDSQVIRRKSNPNMRAIGVLAGYRDLPNSEWRVIQKVSAAPEAVWYRAVVPNNKLKLQVRLQTKGIALTVLQ